MRRRPVQLLVGLLLAVTVTAMGLAAAAARGQTVINGRVAVLCTGGGLVQISLDEAGHPTGGSHLCPDLAASLLGAFRLDLPVVARPEGRIETVAPAPLSLRRFCCHREVRARGPPLAA